MSDSFSLAFAVAQYLDTMITTNRRIFRHRRTYQIVRGLDEAVQLLLAGDLIAPQPRSTLLVEADTSER